MMYFLFVLPAMLFAMWAQARVRGSYQKYAQVRNGKNLSGREVAQILMRNEGLNIGVEGVPGHLTDHYDPQAKVIRLSEGSQDASVAAMAIVAHELGHAQQDKQGYFWLQLRAGIVGIANVGSQFGTWMFFIGILLMSFAGRSSLGMNIAWAGVLLFTGAVLFTLVTLPVEFNASARAKEMLQRNGLVTAEEAAGVNAVLGAAALTYVAGAAQAIAQLLYFITILGGFRRN